MSQELDWSLINDLCEKRKAWSIKKKHSENFHKYPQVLFRYACKSPSSTLASLTLARLWQVPVLVCAEVTSRNLTTSSCESRRLVSSLIIATIKVSVVIIIIVFVIVILIFVIIIIATINISVVIIIVIIIGYIIVIIVIFLITIVVVVITIMNFSVSSLSSLSIVSSS